MCTAWKWRSQKANPTFNWSFWVHIICDCGAFFYNWSKPHFRETLRLLYVMSWHCRFYNQKKMKETFQDWDCGLSWCLVRERLLNLVPLVCHVLKHKNTALVGSWQEKLLPKAEPGREKAVPIPLTGWGQHLLPAGSDEKSSFLLRSQDLSCSLEPVSGCKEPHYWSPALAHRHGSSAGSLKSLSYLLFCTEMWEIYF